MLQKPAAFDRNARLSEPAIWLTESIPYAKGTRISVTTEHKE
ncbi:hypothetical protein ACFQ5D_02170 [Paenibacillus farraposensis]|uniref:Uncharacterized protein n=1 Tax=Paenibacillus farraposensis TaxID=2807095 RepID=A0ABW4D978_9BACL